jgi:hypothetical protein
MARHELQRNNPEYARDKRDNELRATNVRGNQTAVASTTAVQKPAFGITTVTVVNVTAETDLVLYAVPANGLGTVGRCLRLRVGGDFLNNTGSPDVVTFRFKYGTTNLLVTTALSLAASANRRKWRADIDLVAETSSAQRASGVLYISDPVTDSWAVHTASGLVVTGYGTAAETTATVKNLKLTSQFATASANLEITMRMYAVEILK